MRSVPSLLSMLGEQEQIRHVMTPWQYVRLRRTAAGLSIAAPGERVKSDRSRPLRSSPIASKPNASLDLVIMRLSVLQAGGGFR